MADVDTDTFGKHESRPEEPTDTGENISLSLVGPGGRSTWEPTLELGERETSFRGRESQRNRVLKNHVEGLYKKLSQKWARTSEVFHYDLFELIDGKLYFRDKIRPLTTRDGKLKSVKEIKKILGDRGLRDLDFNIPKGVTAKQAAMLNEVEE